MFTKRNAALGFIFVTVLLDMLSFGMVAPLLPKLISDFLNGSTARASEYIGLFTTTWALMQFVFAPVLGMLSDRFGRRPVVLISNFGLALDYAVMALAPTIGWLFLGRVFSGITLRQYSDCDGIYQRRDRARETVEGIRPAGRGIWHGIHSRSGVGRLAWTA